MYNLQKYLPWKAQWNILNQKEANNIGNSLTLAWKLLIFITNYFQLMIIESPFHYEKSRKGKKNWLNVLQRHEKT